MNVDTTSLTTRLSRFVVLATILALPLAISGCDQQVKQEPFGRITPENFFKNEQEFVSAAAAAYAPLRGFIFAPFDMSEHSSDETMVPTRGPDWGDGGIWRDMTQHNWTATHPFLNGAWGSLQTGISRTNSVLASLKRSEALSKQKKAQFAAEMRFMRAFYYYWLMDFFGGVPIVVEKGNKRYDFPQQPVSSDNPPPHNTRKEVYDFILKELTGCTSDNFNEDCVTNPASDAVLANLRPKGEVQYGRATRGAGYAFLARLLINSQVYAVPVGAGQGSASDIGTGPALYAEASAAADQVLNSGRYSLASNYYENFAADNQHTPEIIFAATFKAKAPFSGFTKMMAVWHYNHPVPATPWNGFTTIAEFYNSFENVPNNETRQNQFLVGPQYKEPNESCFGDNCFSDTTSAPVTVRGSNKQLDISVKIPSIQLQGDAAALEAPGARPNKFEIDPNAVQFNMGNDFPLFRLAEMYLIKAEAENQLGNTATAVDMLNTIRTRSGADPVSGTPSQSKLSQLILQERGFEFHFEMLRRQDLIRYEFAYGGVDSDDPYAPTFTGPWLFKNKSAACRALFPIPEQQLSVNPKLKQNPGYPGCASGKPS